MTGTAWFMNGSLDHDSFGEVRNDEVAHEPDPMISRNWPVTRYWFQDDQVNVASLKPGWH